MFRLKIVQCLINTAARTANKPHNYPKLTIATQSRCMSTTKFAKNSPEPDITSNSPEPHVAQGSEHEFLVRLKNDPDTFGGPPEEKAVDEGDLEEERHFEDQPLPSQKLRTKQYADIIKALIKKRKVKEAIDVLEVRMIKEDRVKPENYIFNLVLGACGRVGYTKEAFSLYNQMKKRALKVTGGTYTALFNACANSPWPEDGLTRARHLRNIMIEKMYEPNDTNYNAMIKAFGRCGDLPTAFALADEMASKGFKIKDDTITFLLQACISDKDAGFRHALLVWRKVVDKNIQPSLYTYNLMLRCIRDCGIGDVEVTKDVLARILKRDALNAPQNETGSLEGPDPVKLIENGAESPGQDVESTEIATRGETGLVEDKYRPNLMARVPHLGSIISLSQVEKPEDRLLLVGGMKGFLKNMEEHQCTPNVKTFTQLLDCLPASPALEDQLMKAMQSSKIKPDIDFLNMLIKKRSMRFDYDAAKDVVDVMRKYGYRPNLITYGVLALGCKTKEEALDLVEEMKSHAYRLNTEILGAMLQQACYHKNFPYVLEMMELTLREEVKPNKKFMEHLAEFRKTCRNISNDENNRLAHTKSFQNGHKLFRMRYKTWLEKVEVDEGESEHPWTQFRQTTETEVRHYKDKGARFKPRHASLFKQKTSTKKK